MCEGCSCRYHFGKCSIALSTYKSKSEAWRRSWRCPACRSKKSTCVQGSKSNSNEADFASLFLSVNEKLDGLLGLKDTVKSIEESVKMMSGQYDEILNHIRRQDKEIADIKNRVQKLENHEAISASKNVTQELNELEWHSRKLNLEFHGIPVSKNENALQKVNDIARTMGLPQLTDSDIVSIHRLRAVRDKAPGIIVHFAKQSVREEFLSKRHVLKETKEQCYILENLTKANRILLGQTKAWAKDHGYRYAWHKNGKNFIRKKDGDRAIIVRDAADLERIE